MTPIGSRHAAVVDRLTTGSLMGCGARAIVRVQGPVRLDPHSEPQPDLLVLERRDDFYQDEPPAANDVLLLIEVADSSLQYDQAVKLPLYARAGVREVWLVDLVRDSACECTASPHPAARPHRAPPPRRARGADRVPWRLARGRRTAR